MEASTHSRDGGLVHKCHNLNPISQWKRLHSWDEARNARGLVHKCHNFNPMEASTLHTDQWEKEYDFEPMRDSEWRRWCLVERRARVSFWASPLPYFLTLPSHPPVNANWLSDERATQITLALRCWKRRLTFLVRAFQSTAISPSPLVPIPIIKILRTQRRLSIKMV